MTDSGIADGGKTTVERLEEPIVKAASESDNLNAPAVIRPADGKPFGFASGGGRWKVEGSDTEGRFAIGQYPIPPRTLAVPAHCHHNEDEYSFVLSGTLGALAGKRVVTAGPGAWVPKPRGRWHTMWNAGETTCRVIEVVSPAGFEEYFEEVAAAGDDMADLEAVNEAYGIEMDFESVPTLCERFGLRPPEL